MSQEVAFMTRESSNPGGVSSQRLEKEFKLNKKYEDGFEPFMCLGPTDFHRTSVLADEWTPVEGLYQITDEVTVFTGNVGDKRTSVPKLIKDIKPTPDLIDAVKRNIGSVRKSDRHKYFKWIELYEPRYEVFLETGENGHSYCKSLHELELFYNDCAKDLDIQLVHIQELKRNKVFYVEDLVFSVKPWEQDPKTLNMLGQKKKVINLGSIKKLESIQFGAGEWLRDKQSEVHEVQGLSEIRPEGEVEGLIWDRAKLQQENAQLRRASQSDQKIEKLLSKDDKKLINHAHNSKIPNAIGKSTNSNPAVDSDNLKRIKTEQTKTLATDKSQSNNTAVESD